MGTIDAGTLALAFANEHAARTQAVVAFEAAPRFTPSDNDDFGNNSDALMRMAAAAQAVDVDAHIDIVAPNRRNETGFKSWFRRYTRSASSGIPIQAFMMTIATWDITDRLSSVNAAVLVLHKTRHTILPIKNARALAAALPEGTLVELSGEGSVIFAGDPDEIADEIQEFLTGNRPLPRKDRVLATVLFTDVVGSTQRAAIMGDKDWGELLERHNRLLRLSLERFGGREVSTAGDGFLATFDSPRLAIECALHSGESVRAIGLEIRAGVHTGEIELAGDDIKGIAVHIGARITSLAGAGEVFVSSTVKDLVTGSGMGFEDRGAHILKGVPGEWRIFAVSTGPGTR